MGNFALARIAALVLLFVTALTAEAAPDLPRSVGYTFFVGGKRVGHSDTQVIQSPGVLRFESKFRVESGSSVIELVTHTEADPKTYEIRRFSYKGMRGGQRVASNVTVEEDSVYGAISIDGSDSKKGMRTKVTPIVVWEDWVMEIEILLALQQGLAMNTSNVALVLAGSYATGSATLGYTGQASVDGESQSMVTRKLLVAIQGGEPFESFVDPKRGIPVYVHFPGIRAEMFLDEFFGDNPVSRYPPAPSGSSGR